MDGENHIAINKLSRLKCLVNVFVDPCLLSLNTETGVCHAAGYRDLSAVTEPPGFLVEYRHA